MKTCAKCTLNDNIFSVQIGDDGVCNYCRTETPSRSPRPDPTQAAEALSAFFDSYRDRPYQAVLAYSGGKDSSYALYKLVRDYGVSVLAVTFDNGFLTEQCYQNIRNVTAALGTDSIILRPSTDKLTEVFRLAVREEIFPKKALERASAICTSCIGFVKTAVYREAILRRIPCVVFGWTPGQAPVRAPVIKLDYRMMLANQNQLREPVRQHLGADYDKYFLDPDWLESQKAHIPSLGYPLVFDTYNPDEIIRTVESLGWVKPADTDHNSTNCLLNAYANAQHLHAYGFHPYTMEVAGLVRSGSLTREEGLRQLDVSDEAGIAQKVRDALGDVLL